MRTKMGMRVRVYGKEVPFCERQTYQTGDPEPGALAAVDLRWAAEEFTLTASLDGDPDDLQIEIV